MSVETNSEPAYAAAHLFRAAAGALCLLLLCAAASEARSQDAATQHDTAPPPMKYLPGETRQRLSTADDPKERTRLSLELAEERLGSAERLTAAERYDTAGSELAVYQAIIEDAIRHLQSSSTAKNKHRDLSKRVEITLRSHVPRIETLRRTTPASYAVHIKTALEFVRDARSEALNAFYDDTVLPERRSAKEKSGGGDRAKDGTQAQEKKPDQH